MNVVITGASKGIGLAIAKKFANEGGNLAICSRNEQDILKVAKDLGGEDKVIGVSTDMSKKEDVAKFAKQILSKWQTIDVLVNNAGSFVPGNIHDEPEGNLELMINTNLYSAYNLTRALLPAITKQKGGYIFNISSVAGLQAYNGGGSYSISKFALTGFSKNLRHELTEKNVRVSTVYPGAVYTASWEGSGVDENRIMPANDIANVIWNSYKMSDRTVVEDIVLRPQLGDL